MKKRVLSLFLCAALVLSLAACGGRDTPKPPVDNGDGQETVGPAVTPEQTAPTEPEEPAPEEPTPIPTDEYQRAAWYGFLPEDLKNADPDSAGVTWAEFCDMLGRMIGRYDASQKPAWQELTAGAPDTAMKRDGAMIALTFAAERLGLLEINLQESYFGNLYAAGEQDWKIRIYDYASECSFDYPVFPWDSPCPFCFSDCPQDNYVDPSYFYCTQRASGVSGLRLIDGKDCDFQLDRPLTLRDALLAVIRLYESDYEIARGVKARWDELDYTPEYKQVLAEADALRESILNDASTPEITGTVYYVSNSGNDANDGLTPQTAWATPEKVSTVKLNPGDGVLFERGGVFRGPDKIDREGVFLECQSGVTYAAYGTGPKPVLMGSPESGADPEKWSLYGETPDGGKVWVFYRDMKDCGNIILNSGAIWTEKAVPSWNGSDYVIETGDKFDPLRDLPQNHMFFSQADSLLRQPSKQFNEWSGGLLVGIPLYFEEYRYSSGPLFFRCDEGNPGEVFDSLEFGISPQGTGTPLVRLAGGVVFDNICVTCTGDCGIIGGGGEEVRTVQNCEVSYCGGNVLFIEPNGFPELGGDGVYTQQFSCTVANCYLHDNFDSGFGVEWGDTQGDTIIHDMTVTGNLFERNGFHFGLHWVNEGTEDYTIVFRNFTVTDNIMLDGSNGWSGHFRGGQSCIEYGGNQEAPLNGENMVFRNNIVASFKSSTLIYGACDGYEPPLFENNRLFVPPFYALVDDPEDNVAVILWTNENGNPEEGTDWFWFFAHNCDDFLNGYLGSGNTVQTVK